MKPMNNGFVLRKFAREAVYSVKQIIDQNPFDIVGTTDIAQEVGITRNLLQRGFKECYGTNIKSYQLNQRMSKAKSLLEEGNLSIKQIAYKCGYRSQGNFTFAFKNLYKITPRFYQLLSDQDKQKDSREYAKY